MIKINNDIVKIDTAATTLLLKRRGGELEKLYYGKRLSDSEDYSIFSYKERDFHASVDDDDYFNTVFSSAKGNEREVFVKVLNDEFSEIGRFDLDGYEVIKPYYAVGLPYARDKEETLVVTYQNADKTLQIKQYFSTFKDSDVIACSAELINEGKNACLVERLMSYQMDFCGDGEVTALCGAWGAERKPVKEKISVGTHIFSAAKGFSSNRYNPFLLFTNREGSFGCNLIWSGEHKELVEKTPLGQIRILGGLNDGNLRYHLEAGKSFVAPESLIVYANTQEEVSAKFREFVNHHIIPEKFAYKDRPILLNSWEAMYFDFDRGKLLALAEKAAQVGIELFVLDDGWFGSRNDERGSLGDWYDNVAKTGGVRKLRDAICRKGLKFGIWIEPEMISVDSELYRAHPEYAMVSPYASPIEKRSQLVLDLVNPDVVEFLIERISGIIEEIKPDYIKWDCNRNIFDAHTKAKGHQGGYFYDYIRNLYKILDTITSKYPNVLIEACSAGGNRFDLGMLFYTPQIWCSDNTDVSDRADIQQGTLMAYPQSTIGAHVSASPNHQSKRKATWEDRFNVAITGVFGYELDLLKCTEEELSIIKNQIDFYKKYRGVLLYGDCCFNDGEKNAGQTFVSKDKKTAVSVIYTRNDAVNKIHSRYKLNGLHDDLLYNVRAVTVNGEMTFVCKGDVLNSYGLDFGNIQRMGYAFSTALIICESIV